MKPVWLTTLAKACYSLVTLCSVSFFHLEEHSVSITASSSQKVYSRSFPLEQRLKAAVHHAIKTFLLVPSAWWLRILHLAFYRMMFQCSQYTSQITATLPQTFCIRHSRQAVSLRLASGWLTCWSSVLAVSVTPG